MGAPDRHGVPGSLDASHAIAEAVGGRIPIFLDGGAGRGAPVVKAIALGATACLIGRPQLWGLSVTAADGVAHVLETFRSEIERVMGLCGLRSMDEIGPDPVGAKPRETRRSADAGERAMTVAANR
jgi:isopentenyl diphosphate isomerase/L-lactate dehydrogenase-like FMN-dependent dehydrogenase